MAKNRTSLTNLIIRNAQPDPKGKSPVLIGDGNGLYLQITPGGVKSFIFRFTINKRTRAMGLGPLRTHTLDSARKRARELRVQVDHGIDPLAQKHATASLQVSARATQITFRECAEAYLIKQHGIHRSKKHSSQWRNTVEQYAYPVIGHMAIADIAVKEIISVLEPHWRRIPETCDRLRARLERIFNYAAVMGHRPPNLPNPAKWSGGVGEVLPNKSMVSSVKHHNSLPYKEMPAFMKLLRTDGSMGSLLMQFIILTMARTGEARGAKWEEVDFQEKKWTVPGSRMKGGKEHCVPLCASAISLLEYLKGNNELMEAPSGYVFPGRTEGTSLSSAACAEFLKRIGRTDITTHGMRSSARTWSAETQDFPREVCEAALAHQLRDRVEAAYLRSTLVSKRIQLMDAWGAFCHSE